MGNVLLITGASRGIGASIARIAAARGWRVAINYVRQREAAEKLAADIRSAGGTALPVHADVSVEADVVRMFETMDRELGAVAGLVNNAGFSETQARVEDMTAERIARVLGTNVIGAFLCAREAVRRMSTKRGGRGGTIVNLSSVAVRYGAPNEYVDYAAAKGAVDVMTLGLAREVAEEGIRVNCVRPGVINTEFHARAGEPARVARIAPTVPLKRGGEPDEIAHAVLWLLSDEASYTTGALVDVTGGR